MSSITEYITVAVALVFCGGVITLIAAFRFARSRERDSSKLARWLVLIGGLITLIGGALTAVEQGKMSQKMTELSTQTLAYQTGGNSYPYVGCSQPDSITNTVYCTLYNIGKFPLYDILIHVSNLTMLSQGYRKLDPANPSFWNKFEKIMVEWQWKIGPVDVRPELDLPLGHLPFSAHQDQQDYRFIFTARNGAWDELVQWRWIQGKWEHAIRLSSLPPDTVSTLMEDISAGYPRNEKGQVDWGE